MSEQLTSDADGSSSALKYDPLVNIEHNRGLMIRFPSPMAWNPEGPSHQRLR